MPIGPTTKQDLPPSEVNLPDKAGLVLKPGTVLGVAIKVDTGSSSKDTENVVPREHIEDDDIKMDGKKKNICD